MDNSEESQCWVGVCVTKNEGGGGWEWRAAAAEGVGTTLLVLLSCLAVAGPGADSAGAGAEHGAAVAVVRALTAGAVVAALVQSFDHMSGAQLNPAVTLAKLVGGHLSWRAACAQAAAQLAGGALGAAALSAPGAAVSRPAPGLGALRAAAVEALLTAVLALANLAAWRAPPREKHSWPLRVGAVVAALTLAGGEITGASMNPARSLGPALFAQHYTHLWVYVARPAAGACAGAALHRLLTPPPPPRAGDPATPDACK